MIAIASADSGIVGQESAVREFLQRAREQARHAG
jgi:hypothetical protein